MDVDDSTQKSSDFPDSPDIEKISKMLTESLDVEKDFHGRSNQLHHFAISIFVK